MNYNPAIHHRRSIRLKGYDYSQKGLYFITICTLNRSNHFGKISNGKMILNQYGIIAESEWERTPQIRKNIILGEYIIMPNHFHAIIQIDYRIDSNKENIGQFKSPSQNIGAIIRGFKGATTRQINIIKNNWNPSSSSTGVLQYAPTTELQYALTTELQYAPTTELQYASTASLSKNTRIKNKSIWQGNYWEHIIRNETEYYRISQYIRNNPRKWYYDKLNGGKGNSVMETSSQYCDEIWM